MLERRQFLKVSALTTLFTIVPNLFSPLLANAEVKSNIQDNQQEKGYVAWQFLHGNKKRSRDIVKQLETPLQKNLICNL